MVQDVFSLHTIAGGDNVAFPFNIKDYQRYVFGDDKLAYRYGTDLAKAFIHGPGFGATQPSQPSNTTTGNQGPSNDFAVAVLSEYVPTATHSLRNYFIAYLNRHLVSIAATPACKIDIYSVGKHSQVRHGPQANDTESYHIDRARVQGRTIIVLADIRMRQDREVQFIDSLRKLKVDNLVIFVYLASIDGPANTAALSPILSFVVSPSLKDIESIAQASTFTMNDCFVRFALGQDYTEFCQFIRRQDDCPARQLLDYAIGGGYYDDDLYKQNVKFLLWEVGARESL
ncbi:PRTase ComF-like protein [Pyrenochaeta sp. MPI-SDFR-AT-0127]|nr:PRTase ComF-like protein [Pyrenochaeta sp. MPI-SDFR-AT-0127]